MIRRRKFRRWRKRTTPAVDAFLSCVRDVASTVCIDSPTSLVFTGDQLAASAEAFSKHLEAHPCPDSAIGELYQLATGIYVELAAFLVRYQHLTDGERGDELERLQDEVMLCSARHALAQSQ
jgi:hypothetical protein